MQDEIPAADADWESSVEGEPSSEKLTTAKGEPSSAEKETEVEQSSAEKDESCIVVESCKVCEKSLTGEKDETPVEEAAWACEEKSSDCEDMKIHVEQ